MSSAFGSFNASALGAYVESPLAARGGKECILLLADDGAPGDYFGWDTAVSGDGNTILVGAPRAGAVYVFTRSGETFDQSAKLTGGGNFGRVVEISDDGLTALVMSSINLDQPPRFLYIFKFFDGAWQRQNTAIFDLPRGYLSGDGNSFVVSFNPAYIDVAIYRAPSWTEDIHIVDEDARRDWPLLGCAISYDGGRVVIGANDDATNAIYIYSGANQEAIFSQNPEVVGGFGSVLAISGDGATVAAGGASGDTWIYVLENGGWQEQAVLPEGGVFAQRLLSHDGNLFVHGFDIYKRTAGAWAKISKFGTLDGSFGLGDDVDDVGYVWVSGLPGHFSSQGAARVCFRNL